jgi:putative permease
MSIKGRSGKDFIFLLVLIAAGLLVLSIAGVTQLVVIAALLAYILDPLVTTMEFRGLSRTMATVVLVVMIFAIIGVLSFFLVPALIQNVQALQSGGTSTQAMAAVTRCEQLIRTKLGFLGLADINLMEKIDQGRTYMNERIMNFLVTDSLSIIVSLVSIPFIMFFLLKDGRELKKGFVGLVPNRYFEFSLDLLHKMDRQLGNYMRGQFLDALIFGALTTAALWILNVKYFLFIGIFAGLANLIPFVGPIAGVLPAVIVSVLDNGDVVKAVVIVLVFAGLKLVDDVVVQPLAIGKTVNLHPMVVLVAILVGGHLFGILGMLLAVPCAGFLKVVLQESIVTFRKYRFD